MGEAAFVISDADDGLRERLSQEISASTSRRPDWPTARCWVSPSGKTEVPARGAGRVDVGRLRLHRAGWRIGWVLVHLGWLCRAKTRTPTMSWCYLRSLAALRYSLI